MKNFSSTILFLFTFCAISLKGISQDKHAFTLDELEHICTLDSVEFLNYIKNVHRSGVVKFEAIGNNNPNQYFWSADKFEYILWGGKPFSLVYAVRSKPWFENFKVRMSENGYNVEEDLPNGSTPYTNNKFSIILSKNLDEGRYKMTMFIENKNDYVSNKKVFAEKLNDNTYEIFSNTNATNIYLVEGQKISIQASGRINYGLMAGSGNINGIYGYTSYNRVRGYNHGVLLYRIGSTKWQQITSEKKDITVTNPGILDFLVNDADASNNSGSFKVQITSNQSLRKIDTGYLVRKSFGRFTKDIQVFHNFITKSNPNLAKAPPYNDTLNRGYVNIPNNYKDFTQEEYSMLATSKYSVHIYDVLISLIFSAVEVDTLTKQPTEDAKLALKALAYLAPRRMKIEDFGNMISDINNNNKNLVGAARREGRKWLADTWYQQLKDKKITSLTKSNLRALTQKYEDIILFMQSLDIIKFAELFSTNKITGKKEFTETALYIQTILTKLAVDKKYTTTKELIYDVEFETRRTRNKIIEDFEAFQ